jgi:4-amino-4-deoxy-L-arabinose transferase-like glycosyltransferase
MYSLFTIALVGAMGVVLAMVRGGFDRRDSIWAVLAIALLIRIVLVIVTYNVLPHDWLDIDWRAYERAGAEVVRSDSLEPVFTRGPSFIAHAIANAAVFWLVGVEPIAMRLFSGVFGAFTCAMVFLLAERLSDDRATATFAGLVAAVWPTFLAWSVQNSKDTVLAFALLSVAYCMLVATRRIRLSLVVVVGLLLALITALRAYLGVLLFPLCAVYLLIVGVRRRAPKLVVPVAVLTAIAAVALMIGVGATELTPSLGDDPLQTINRLRLFYAHGSASMDVRPFTSYLDLVAYVPVGLAHFFLRPFPWELGSLNQSLGAFEMTIFYLFLWGMVRALPGLLRTRRAWMYFMIAMLLVVGTLYGVIEGNLGSMFKHRLPFALMIIAIGSEWLTAKLRSISAASRARTSAEPAREQ